ncbi:hypothetical protein PR048_001617 [Dryococelus australis]|uniref:Uncharacterized protein n=1 Tax=Dryococelus australis TaxID=614101 RepID=A0ABQ9IKB3_9NEOP|nr:hypothetical protein PR048_001617 [Dryococelus australis]
MMEYLRPPKLLSLEGDLGRNWKRWQQQFEIYLKASGAEKKDDVKIAILLHVLGEDAQELYSTLNASAANAKNYCAVILHLENYLLPKTNKSMEHHIFNNRIQEEVYAVQELHSRSNITYGETTPGNAADHKHEGVTIRATRKIRKVIVSFSLQGRLFHTKT